MARRIDKNLELKIIFQIEGIVKGGEKKGSQLGFPTANVVSGPGLPSGIFAGEATWNGQSYPAAVYKEDGKNVVEAYLLDFSGNLYGEHIKIIASKKIRDVKKFQTEEELIIAIKNDVDEIKECLRE